jgi:hypothetical protein
MMSESLITKETSLPDCLDLKYWFENSGRVCMQRTMSSVRGFTDPGSSVRGRQVPLVEVDEVRVHGSGFLQTNEIARSKEKID